MPYLHMKVKRAVNVCIEPCHEVYINTYIHLEKLFQRLAGPDGVMGVIFWGFMSIKKV